MIKTVDTFRTIKVSSSEALASADGRVAIALHLRSGSTIALEVDLERVRILQLELAEIETFLLRQPGNA